MQKFAADRIIPCVSPCVPQAASPLSRGSTVSCLGSSSACAAIEITGSASVADATAPFRSGNRCFNVEHRGKQVTQLFEARHYLLRFEYQQVGIFFLESALGFLPRHRRRNRGMLTRPQRIHGNRLFCVRRSGSSRQKLFQFEAASSSPIQPCLDVRVRATAPARERKSWSLS